MRPKFWKTAMNRTAGASVALAVILCVLSGPSLAKTPPGAVGDGTGLEEDVVEVEAVIVTARRPGRDPSSASTECIWDQLPADQRAALSQVADTAVSTLTNHDDLPLTTPRLTDAAARAALLACGGSGRDEHLPFVRVGLAGFAVEKASLVTLQRNRIPEAKLMHGWSLLAEPQRDAMLVAAANPDDEPEDLRLLVSGLFKVLRAVRPFSAWNPLEYRNGSTNHRVIFFYEAHSVRRAMERRF